MPLLNAKCFLHHQWLEDDRASQVVQNCAHQELSQRLPGYTTLPHAFPVVDFSGFVVEKVTGITAAYHSSPFLSLNEELRQILRRIQWEVQELPTLPGWRWIAGFSSSGAERFSLQWQADVASNTLGGKPTMPATRTCFSP